jgi:hypothetical protein
VLTIAVGFLADRTGQPGVCNTFVSLIGVVGFAMFFGLQRSHVKSAGTFLGALGIYPCIPNTIAWAGNNTGGVYKRGIVLGFVIGWGKLNGIVRSNIYFHAPKFTDGHATILAYMIACLFRGRILMTLLLHRENTAILGGKRDHLVQGMSKQEAERLGDNRPDFLYAI